MSKRWSENTACEGAVDMQTTEVGSHTADFSSKWTHAWDRCQRRDDAGMPMWRFCRGGGGFAGMDAAAGVVGDGRRR